MVRFSCIRPGLVGLFQSNNVLNCQRRMEKGKHIPRFTRTRSDMVKDKAAVAGSYTEARFGGNNASAMGAVMVHLLCGLGLGIAVWFCQSVESVSLVSDPVHTLRLISAIQCPIVILLFSRYRRNPETCSYLKAVVRGALALPVGALVNALGAIALGAPVGTQFLWRTIQWSCMMSAFTFVPAGSVFGSSGSDWQRIFAYTKPVCFIDYMICIPAHGAIIGAWFGAWPMPLDWERPWQDWPICVSYGAILGYVLGMLASIGFILHHKRHQRIKID